MPPLKRTLSSQSIRRTEAVASDNSKSTLLLASPSDKVSSPVSKILEKGQRGVFEQRTKGASGGFIGISGGGGGGGGGSVGGTKRPANDDLRRKVLLQSAKKAKLESDSPRRSPRLFSRSGDGTAAE
jgi:hypothetical protein